MINQNNPFYGSAGFTPCRELLTRHRTEIMSRNRRHIRIRIFSSRIVFNPFRDETQGMETYPDLGEGQTQETYYEYDYNEISGPTSNLPLADIQAHPENYLEYAYSPAASDPVSQNLQGVSRTGYFIRR